MARADEIQKKHRSYLTEFGLSPELATKNGRKKYFSSDKAVLGDTMVNFLYDQIYHLFGVLDRNTKANPNHEWKHWKDRILSQTVYLLSVPNWGSNAATICMKELGERIRLIIENKDNQVGEIKTKFSCEFRDEEDYRMISRNELAKQNSQYQCPTEYEKHPSICLFPFYKVRYPKKKNSNDQDKTLDTTRKSKFESDEQYDDLHSRPYWSILKYGNQRKLSLVMSEVTAKQLSRHPVEPRVYNHAPDLRIDDFLNDINKFKRIMFLHLGNGYAAGEIAEAFLSRLTNGRDSEIPALMVSLEDDVKEATDPEQPAAHGRVASDFTRRKREIFALLHARRQGTRLILTSDPGEKLIDHFVNVVKQKKMNFVVYNYDHGLAVNVGLGLSFGMVILCIKHPEILKALADDIYQFFLCEQSASDRRREAIEREGIVISDATVERYTDSPGGQKDTPARRRGPRDPASQIPSGSAHTMPGLASELYRHCCLLLCGSKEFNSENSLAGLFVTNELEPFRNNIPDADDMSGRVVKLIAYLKDKRLANNRAVLPIFLRTLRDKYHENDQHHAKLNQLADEVAIALGEPAEAAQRPVEGGSREVTSPAQEATGGSAGFSNAHDIAVLTRHIQAVAKVRVPKIVQGMVKESIPTGTGFLVAPGLVLTCAHVVEARGGVEGPVDEDDLPRQALNALLLFGHDEPTTGVPFSVAKLEAFDKERDYAVLRLNDREDTPFEKWGWVPLDPHMPLSNASTFQVVQHPGGRILQLGPGRFDRIFGPHFFLYNGTTDAGASGAPILDSETLDVVAMHRATDDVSKLRVGVTIRVVLDHLKVSHPALHDEIMAAQRAGR